MLGLEILMAGMLSLAPTPVNADVACHIKSPPKIIVKPSKSRVKYDFSKTKAQLNNVDVDTVSPYGPNHKTTISGLMSGAIEVKSQISFMHETYEKLSQGCVYLKSINVSVHVDPTVFIAKEYPPGSCMHNAVKIHEHKHVKEDQLIVSKYVGLIETALVKAIKSQNGSFGPYDTSRMETIQSNVQKALNTIVRKYNDKMNLERSKRQQAIDSYEEYESIGSHCRRK